MNGPTSPAHPMKPMNNPTNLIYNPTILTDDPTNPMNPKHYMYIFNETNK